METPDHRDRVRRPELDHYEPDEVFIYARDKQRWLREKVADRYITDAIEHLANELDDHVSQLFDEGPKLEIQATQVYQPSLLSLQDDRFQIESKPLDFGEDARLLGAHNLTGILYGFHHTKLDGQSQLSVYLSRDDPTVKLQAGIYKPLWSVPIEGAEIRFAREREAELLRKIGGFVMAVPEEHRIAVNTTIKELLSILDDSTLGVAERLRQSGTSVAFLIQQKSLPGSFGEALLDTVRYKLDLLTPLSVHASSHRIITSTPHVKSFTQEGEGSFHDVIPQLEMIGESARRSLGLFFYDGDKAIHVPIEAVESVRQGKPL